MGNSIESLVAEFERRALAWSQASGHRAKNREFDKMVKVARAIRDTEEGRLAFETLLTHPDPGVQLHVAGKALAWDSRDAIGVLEELARRHPDANMTRFIAEITLEEYRSGRTDFSAN